MDGGAWWAAVHGVAKSRTRLSDFTFAFTVLTARAWVQSLVRELRSHRPRRVVKKKKIKDQEPFPRKTENEKAEEQLDKGIKVSAKY